MTDTPDEFDIYAESHRLFKEALSTGRMTLANGTVVLLTQGTLTRMVADTVKMRPPKGKKLPTVTDFAVAKTRHTDDGA